MGFDNGFLTSDLATLSELKARCAKVRPPAPGPESAEAIRRLFSSVDYRNEVPKLYDALVGYGAAELEHLNRKGLVIKGRCGIGKTLGVEILAAHFKWSFTSAVDFVKAYTENGAGAFDALADGLNFFGDPPRVLVIDDLGAEPRTARRYGEERNVLAYVLERRYRIGFQRHHSRTVVTTNLTDAELERRYGSRINDRLNEMAEFICADGESLRR